MRRRQILVANKLAAERAREVPGHPEIEGPPPKMFACECGKEFPYQGSLNLHKRACWLNKTIIARLDAEYGRYA